MVPNGEITKAPFINLSFLILSLDVSYPSNDIHNLQLRYGSTGHIWTLYSLGGQCFDY